jgi:hypothetical protein
MSRLNFADFALQALPSGLEGSGKSTSRSNEWLEASGL